MQDDRMKDAPDTVAYADGEHHKLIVEFAIPGSPTETIDVKILAARRRATRPCARAAQQ